MHVGFFFWPFNTELVLQLTAAADQYGYDMIGIADTPGNAMDPWVAATLAAERAKKTRVALCVTNIMTRHPAVSAAGIASLDLLAPGRTVLGIGAGHSGTRNIGAGDKSKAADMGEAITFMKTLLRGESASWQGGKAQLPWVKSRPLVFMAGSHPLALRTAGASADGVFANFGLHPENIRESEALIAVGSAGAGRVASEVEIWQIAALDCHPDGELARNKVGAMLAFLAGYVIGEKNLPKRGVPESLVEPLLELRRRYSTRPGDADIRLVRELGLFDYLSHRLSICGTAEECLAQALRAHRAGAKRLMLTVSLAADPVLTIRLFGEQVLPKLRAL